MKKNALQALWKRVVSGMVAMLLTVTIFPLEAFASLLDNPPNQNEEILATLQEFWGDDKTAEEAMALLAEYGLVDEQGNVVEDFTGAVTIADPATNLSLKELHTTTAQTVVVNSRVATAASMQQLLTNLQTLGVFDGAHLEPHWQLTWGGLEVAPAAMLGHLSADVTKEATVLGQTVDKELLFDVLDLLDAYGLLSDNGAKTLWQTQLIGTPKETTLQEVEALLDDPNQSRDQILALDGDQMTLGDFETVLAIEEELARIEEIYTADQSENLTAAHEQALASLEQQLLADGGIALMSTDLADLVFPSGIDHSLRLTTPETLSLSAGGTAILTLSLSNAAAQPVSVDWRIDTTSVDLSVGGQKSGTVTFATGEQTKTLTVQSNDVTGSWNGDDQTAIHFQNLVGARFVSGNAGSSTTVTVSNTMTLPSTAPINVPLSAVPVLDDNGVQTEWYGTKDVFNTSENRLDVSHSSSNAGTVIFPMTVTAEMKEQFSQGLLTHLQVGAHAYGQELSGGSLQTTITVRLYYGDPGSSEYVETTYTDGAAITWTTLAVDPARLATLNEVHVQVRLKPSKVEGSSGLCYINGLRFIDNTLPTVTATAAEDQTYYIGQKLPYQVTFSEPVKGAITATATALAPFTVADADMVGATKTLLSTIGTGSYGSLQISSIQGFNDLRSSAAQSHTVTETYRTTTIQPVLYDAIQMPTAVDPIDPVYTAGLGEDAGTTTATAMVTVPLSTIDAERQLALSTYTDKDGNVANATFAASIDGGQTLTSFTYDDNDNPTALQATFEVEATATAQDFLMEIYEISTTGSTATKGNVLIGKYGAFTVNAPIPLTKDNFSVNLPDDWPTKGVYLDKPPTLQLTADLIDVEDQTFTQYHWESSDEQIAVIDPVTGDIGFLKVGDVQFRAVAENGDITAFQGDDYSSDWTVPITVQEGATPYITMATETVTLRAGDPLTVRWASNLAQKQEEHLATGEDRTITFTVTATPTNGGEEIEQEITFDPDNKGDTPEEIAAWPNQAVVFTSLSDISVGETPSYNITVSATPHDDVPRETTGVIVSEPMAVIVKSPAVVVKLTRPPQLVITDEKDTFTVHYTMANFDALNQADFKVQVINNETGAVQSLNPTTVLPQQDGSFTFQTKVENGLRNIYDITIEAKNPNEASYSRDTYTLYVYKKDSLDIVADAVTNRVLVTDDQVTVDNSAWIQELLKTEGQDAVLALERDIFLQTALSINNDSYPWSDALDRIRWESSVDTVASINYELQSGYADIQDLAYTSFAPASEFLLSGNGDGTTDITAIHDFSDGQLQSAITVDVNTLKDKLYLLQVYPVSVATISYQNGAGEQKQVTTDAEGQAAIYEESGIVGEVYVESKVSVEGVSELFLGTLQADTLLTGEHEALSLDLYPLNTVQMRQASSVPIYLKTPTGEDLNGVVATRVGVYRNGEYLPHALVDNQATGTGVDATDYLVDFENGKYTFRFDVTQFVSEDQTNPITAADDIVFAFEFKATDPTGASIYYPVFMELDGTANADQVIRTGEQIVRLTAVENKETAQENPFVAEQRIYIDAAQEGLGINITGIKTRLGPSVDVPYLALKTVSYWWGETDWDGKEKGHTELKDEHGISLGIVIRDPEAPLAYPFTSYPVTVQTTLLTDKALKAVGIGDLETANPVAHYYVNGENIANYDLPLTIMNTTTLPSALAPDQWDEEFARLRALSENSTSSMSIGDPLIDTGVGFLTNLATEVGLFEMILEPTDNPLVYEAHLFAGLNNIEGDNVSGAQADVSRGSDFDPAPGLAAIKGVYNQGLAGYAQSATNQVTNAMKMLSHNVTHGRGSIRSSDKDTLYALSGYCEAKVYYDLTDKAWKMVVVNGGFTAGGGLGYHWIFNTQVGPVPMFLELGLGASAVVNFKAAINHSTGGESYNDYLTELRVNAYFQAFGGLGFDYTVLAMKIGIFGQVGLDLQFRWLHAMEAAPADVKYAYQVGLTGSIGIKLQMKFLFISYEKILFSKSLPQAEKESVLWQGIEEYWAAVGKGMFDEERLPTFYAAAPMMISEEDGMVLYSASTDATLTDRDYLTRGEPRAVFGMDSMAMRLANVYPDAAITLSDDGQHLFYLDDLDDPTDATALRAAVLTEGSGTPVILTEGVVEGYGDSYLKAAGTGDQTVLAFSRLTEAPAVTEPGQSITPSMQAMMQGSSEIMVASRSGGSWTVEQLTDNDGVVDTAPAIATNGSRTVVVWRQTVSATEEVLGQNSKDYLLYRVKEGDVWGPEQVLYTGDLGNVKGLQTEMAADGKTLVSFVVDTTGATDYSGQEVLYAVLAPTTVETETTFGVTRYVRATEDHYLDENPQLAVVDYQGEELFVLGWHSLNNGTTEQQSNIRLMAMDTDGNRLTAFVDNLATLTENDNTRVSSTFTFSQGATTLEELSILWREGDVTLQQSEDPTTANRDKVSALRFTVADDGRIDVTAAQEMAIMDESTSINTMVGITQSNGSLALTILGTYYDPTNLETIFVSSAEGISEVQLPQETTNIYAVQGSYTDSVSVEQLGADYQNLQLGATIPVSFSVTNHGTVPIDQLTLAVGSTVQTVDATVDPTFVPIQAGQSRTLYLSHKLPLDQLKDEDYTVTATFANGATDAVNGKAILDIADVGIAQKAPVVSAQDGQRVLEFTLFNNSVSTLAGSDREVHLQLFSDPDYQQPIDDSYLSLAGVSQNLLTLTTTADLQKVDEGYYSARYTFDLQAYAQQEETLPSGMTHQPFLDEDGEIRDGGITLYARVWMEQEEEGEMVESPEYFTYNNGMTTEIVGLLEVDDATPVSIQGNMMAVDDSKTVAVTLQNNSIVQSQKGNIAVTLFDENNQIVGWQQSYTTDHTLLKLDPEERYQRSFVFEDVPTATSFAITYDEKVTLDNEASLNAFTLAGVDISLDDFVSTDEKQYTATTLAEDIGTTTLSTPAKGTGATVSIVATTAEEDSLVPEAESTGGVKTVTLDPGNDTVITVTVTAEDGITQKVYTLTVINRNSIPIVTDIPSAEVVYKQSDVVLNVVAHATNEAATLTYQWYQYQGKGVPTGDFTVAEWQPMTGATETTYTIPTDRNVGDYYYFCAVTGTNTEAQSFTVNSNLVQVTIDKSQTTFTDGIQVQTPDGTTIDTVTYGDSFQVLVTPDATGQAPNILDTIWSWFSTAPTVGEMALFVGDQQITPPQAVQEGETLTFTIDTFARQLAVGENVLTAKFGGGDNLLPHAETCAITLQARSITDASITVKEDDFTYSGTPQQVLVTAVTVDGQSLTAGANGDYQMSGDSQTDAGAYLATVIGQGYYTGETTVGYRIAKQQAPAITFPTAGDLVYGQRLALSTLTGGSTTYGSFHWQDDSTVPTVGNSSFTVQFVPSASTIKNYTAITETTAMIAVLTKKATPTMTLIVAGDSNAQTITAQVVGVGNDLLSGTVTFTKGNVTLGKVLLTDGKATLDVTLTAGTHTLTAQFTPTGDTADRYEAVTQSTDYHRAGSASHGGGQGSGTVSTTTSTATTSSVPSASSETTSTVSQEQTTPPSILEGKDQTLQSGVSLRIVLAGEVQDYLETRIDDQPVPADQVTVEGDRLAVTVSADYLQQLQPGTHTLQIVLADQTIETTFTLLGEAEETTTTGWLLPTAVAAILLLAGGIAGGLWWHKRKLQS